MITKPKLPPKVGYTEVVNPDGAHVYKKIVTEEAQKMELMEAQIAAQSDQMDFYEECIVEMAAIVYA